MKKLYSALALLALLYHPAIFADNYKFTETLSLDANSLTELRVKTGAGELVVTGSDDAQIVELVAKVGGKRVERDDVTITLQRKGKVAEVVATFKGSKWGEHFIDVVVVAPAKLKLDVDDTSGDAKIEGFNNGARIDDTSGELFVHNMMGAVRIDDTSGDLSIRAVRGGLIVDDSSGEITIEKVTGDIRLDDNSGDIRIETIVGDVRIDDGSGDIEVLNVAGKVEIDDGSGDIKVDGAHSFELLDDGSGDVDVNNKSNGFTSDKK